MSAEQIAAILRSHAFHWTIEIELQDAIATALTAAGVPFLREHKLAPGDRIDFLAGTVGLEVKIGGSLANLTRQLHRYAQSPRIAELVVVLGRRRLEGLPSMLCEKPLHVVSLWRSSL